MLPPVEFEIIKCAKCGTESSFRRPSIETDLSWHYLDARPQDDIFNDFEELLLRQCPSCKYFGEDIAQDVNNLNEIVNKFNYKEQINNKLFPNKANLFLCNSLTHENKYKFEKAAFSALFAAWICDSQSLLIQAKNCRLRAIEMLNMENAMIYKSKDEMLESILEYIFHERPIYKALILIDLYRRTEQFEKSLALCDSYLRFQTELNNEIILNYQKYLNENQDIGCYTFDDAEEFCYQIGLIPNDDDYEDDYYDGNDYDRDYFNTMTDGMLGDYDDFIDNGGNLDDIDTWSRG